MSASSKPFRGPRLPDRVAIVGGGVTGLAAAFELERITGAEIDLYEASPRLGGKVRTRSVGDLLVEVGPDAFFARKPGAMEAIRDLGLEDATVTPILKEFRMLVGGRLYRVPGGLVTLTTSDPTAIEDAEFLSPEAKARAKAEGDQPPRNPADPTDASRRSVWRLDPPSGIAEETPSGTRKSRESLQTERLEASGEPATDDESLRSFFTRRFGAEFTRLIVEPLLAGTHGGDADRLSMRALYPGYFDLERRHGSLAAGMAGRPATPSSPSFLSFQGGMEELIHRLRDKLSRTRIHLSHPIEDVRKLDADRILLAIPANYAAPALAPVAPETAGLLRQIRHRSSAIVTLAFRRAQIADPLDGTGFLVPASESIGITGCTWSSEKWPGRAPADVALMRVFLGGESVNAPDEDLLAQALGAVTPLLGIHGAPLYTEVTRWIDALPQYEVGHLDRIDALEATLAREASHVTLAGTSYRGVGVPDCLRQGREAAHRICQSL